ncbi:MAG: tRNA (guanosine(46)-N7)-methyltransferase TrmB [Mariprofundaceae bacterium]
MRLSKEFRDQFIQHEMRTYGRKNGYVTKGQEERLTRLMPLIALDAKQKLCDAKFLHQQPIIMEIGFGNGDFLLHLAETHPEWNLLGVEIYLPAIAKAVSKIEDAESLGRVRISQLPAQAVLSSQVNKNELHGIYINHPDPWPKAKHHKRRIIQKDFANLMVSSLKSGGFLKLATDQFFLAEWMRDILDETPQLTNQALKGGSGFCLREEGRVVTKFEARGTRNGRDNYFLHYVKS